MRRAALALGGAAAAAVGVLAEQQGYGWADLRGWLPDLLAGWTLAALGLVLLASRRPPGAGALLLLAGFAWFAANFATTGPAAVEWIAARATFVHRGPLLALALATPAGRPWTRLAAGGIALAWLAAVAWPLWDDNVAALALCAVFVGIAAAELARASGRRGRALARLGLTAVAVLAAAIAADAVRSLAGASQAVTDGTVLGYDAAAALAGVLLFAAALQAAPASLADRAVALERGGARLRDALRDLLGDPGLELGFAGAGGDARRRPRPPASRSRRRAGSRRPWSSPDARRRSSRTSRRASRDEATRTAVLAAVGLAAERARLRSEVGRRIEAVEASRRRLLLAEEEERRRLAGRLDRGAGAALAELDALVRAARRGADGALAAALERAAEQVARARPELDSLVRGLGGVDSKGLRRALERLADGAPVAVELDLAEVALPAGGRLGALVRLRGEPRERGQARGRAAPCASRLRPTAASPPDRRRRRPRRRGRGRVGARRAGGPRWRRSAAGSPSTRRRAAARASSRSCRSRDAVSSDAPGHRPTAAPARRPGSRSRRASTSRGRPGRSHAGRARAPNASITRSRPASLHVNARSELHGVAGFHLTTTSPADQPGAAAARRPRRAGPATRGRRTASPSASPRR